MTEENVLKGVLKSFLFIAIFIILFLPLHFLLVGDIKSGLALWYLLDLLGVLRGD